MPILPPTFKRLLPRGPRDFHPCYPLVAIPTEIAKNGYCYPTDGAGCRLRLNYGADTAGTVAGLMSTNLTSLHNSKSFRPYRAENGFYYKTHSKPFCYSSFRIALIMLRDERRR
jgi:hypothetical protein